MSSKGLLIKLNKQELALCKQAASMRWQLARAAGVVNQRKDSRSDAQIDYLGIRAEQAVAKAYGIDYFPTSLGIDDGADMFVNDLSIDVKSTFHSDGRLLIKSKDAVKADIFVLVSDTPDEDLMKIIGWTSKQKFLSSCEETDFMGKGKCYTMDQSALYRPANLWLFLVTHLHGAAA